MKRSALSIPEPRLNTATQWATSLARLSPDGWQVIASRPTNESVPWVYADAITRQFPAFERLRDLGAIVMTQRRDDMHWVLLAKVSRSQALAWIKLLHRELDKLPRPKKELVA